MIDIEIAKSCLKLTLCMLLVSSRLHPVLLELNSYDRLYNILSASRSEFKNEDIFEILNTFFNLATKGYYHYVVEKPIMPDINLKIEDQIADLDYGEQAPLWKYIPIKEKYFISMILKCLFEWKVCKNIKNFYLQILENMMENSLSNSGICLQVICSS